MSSPRIHVRIGSALGGLVRPARLKVYPARPKWRIFTGGGVSMLLDSSLVGEFATREEAEAFLRTAPLAFYTLTEFDGNKTNTIRERGWFGAKP